MKNVISMEMKAEIIKLESSEINKYFTYVSDISFVSGSNSEGLVVVTHAQVNHMS